MCNGIPRLKCRKEQINNAKMNPTRHSLLCHMPALPWWYRGTGRFPFLLAVLLRARSWVHDEFLDYATTCSSYRFALLLGFVAFFRDELLAWFGEVMGVMQYEEIRQHPAGAHEAQKRWPLYTYMQEASRGSLPSSVKVPWPLPRQKCAPSYDQCSSGTGTAVAWSMFIRYGHSGGCELQP